MVRYYCLLAVITTTYCRFHYHAIWHIAIVYFFTLLLSHIILITILRRYCYFITPLLRHIITSPFHYAIRKDI